MGSEGMAERMWSRRVRQAERRAGAGDPELNDTWRKLLAARADKQRPIRRQRDRTELEIVRDCLARDWQNRHNARLAAFALHTEHVAPFDWGVLALERQRL